LNDKKKKKIGTIVDFHLTSSVIWILKQNQSRISVLESLECFRVV